LFQIEARLLGFPKHLEWYSFMTLSIFICITVVITNAYAETTGTFNFNPTSAISYIEMNAQQLNFADLILNEVPIIYFGEKHGDLQPKKMFLEEMNTLKMSGITHLAMEMFNSNRQEMLDQYYSDELPREEIINLLRDEWGWLPNAYMEVVDAAKENSIKIIALDGRHLIVDEEGLEEKLKRDYHMAQVLGKVYNQTSTDRIVVFAGQSHTQQIGSLNPTQPEILLTEEGIKSISYVFDCSDLDEYEYESFFRTMLKESKVSSNRIFVPTPRTVVKYDGYIFLD